jgi:GntR family transcriptional regulator
MEIQRNIPLIEQLKTILLERIQTGAYAAGTRFPSEAELCEQFGVSRATVRSALADLTARGLLVRQAGVGTFLAGSRQLTTGLERLESVLAVAQRSGHATSFDHLAICSLVAGEELARRLQVDSDTPITLVARSIRVDGEIVSYHEDYVPARLMPADRLGDFTGSVLDWLADHHPLPVSRASTEITAINASGLQTRHLAVSPGCALILLRETLEDEIGAVLGYSENYFVPNRFDLQLIRRR